MKRNNRTTVSGAYQSTSHTGSGSRHLCTPASADSASTMQGRDSLESHRRRLLGALMASGMAWPLIPDHWSRPVVDAVLLPAHAQTTSTDSTPPGAPACGATTVVDFTVSDSVLVPDNAISVTIIAIGGGGGGGGAGSSSDAFTGDEGNEGLVFVNGGAGGDGAAGQRVEVVALVMPGQTLDVTVGTGGEGGDTGVGAPTAAPGDGGEGGVPDGNAGEDAPAFDFPGGGGGGSGGVSRVDGSGLVGGAIEAMGGGGGGGGGGGAALNVSEAGVFDAGAGAHGADGGAGGAGLDPGTGVLAGDGGDGGAGANLERTQTDAQGGSGADRFTLEGDDGSDGFVRLTFCLAATP